MFSYRRAKTMTDLEEMLDDLYLGQLMPLKSRGLGIFIYTQLADVAQVRNGLLTADRERLKVDAERMRRRNEDWLNA